jgi:hypothetical protein
LSNPSLAVATATRLRVKIHTSDRVDAGTHGDVYLGIGGREFRIESGENDFEKGSVRTYGVIKTDPGEIQINDQSNNDPEKNYLIIIGDLDKYPVYIRFEPENQNDHWTVQYVSVAVFSQLFVQKAYEALQPENDDQTFLTLGTSCGKYLYLHIHIHV